MIEISPSSPEYPTALSERGNAKSLFALGDISLLQERKIAVVGSRRTPANALKVGAEICKRLSKEFVLLTGTADGGDSAAIEGALQGSGRVICVLAGGFSALPQANLALLERVIKSGLLLSAQEFDTPVRAFSYEGRNELLARLSDGVLVLGAGEKSGALITAKYAKAYGKRIFALPYPPNSSSGCGCNRLIKEGGYLVESAEDIALRYGVDVKEEKREIPLTEEERRVYEAVKDGLELHVSEIAARTQIPAFKLKAIASALEVKGLLLSMGGNRYSIV